jgi:hypothetical protein
LHGYVQLQRRYPTRTILVNLIKDGPVQHLSRHRWRPRHGQNGLFNDKFVRSADRGGVKGTVRRFERHARMRKILAQRAKAMIVGSNAMMSGKGAVPSRRALEKLLETDLAVRRADIQRRESLSCRAGARLDTKCTLNAVTLIKRTVIWNIHVSREALKVDVTPFATIDAPKDTAQQRLIDAGRGVRYRTARVINCSQDIKRVQLLR